MPHTSFVDFSTNQYLCEGETICPFEVGQLVVLKHSPDDASEWDEKDLDASKMQHDTFWKVKEVIHIIARKSPTCVSEKIEVVIERHTLAEAE